MNNNWKTFHLGELLEGINRATPLEPTRDYKLVGVRLEGNGAFLRETKQGSAISAKTLYEIKSGDFVYSRLFAWRGAFGIVGDDLDGCFVSNEFPVFRPIPNKLNIKFLNYWFRLPNILKSIESDCTGSTPLTRNRFKESFFLDLTIPLPPLSEQQRIVAKIEQLASKIEEVRQKKNDINEEAKVILRSVFVKVIEGASQARIYNVAPLKRREIEISVESEYFELAVRSFGRGIFHKPTLRGSELTWQKLFQIYEGDIILSNIKAWEGAIAVAGPKDDGCVGSHRYLTLVPIDGKILADFLCFYLLSEKGLADIGSASPGSADRNRTLGQKALQEIEVPVPSYAKQLHFCKLLQNIKKMIASQRDSEKILDALLPSILDKAFKGEL